MLKGEREEVVRNLEGNGVEPIRLKLTLCSTRKAAFRNPNGHGGIPKCGVLIGLVGGGLECKHDGGYNNTKKKHKE
jgi:hypothetical protein